MRLTIVREPRHACVPDTVTIARELRHVCVPDTVTIAREPRHACVPDTVTLRLHADFEKPCHIMSMSCGQDITRSVVKQSRSLCEFSGHIPLGHVPAHAPRCVAEVLVP